jgi:hypothetical protein
LKERLVADWLTKAGERGGIDVALCQILLAQGCRILKFGHGPTEAGKDIIAFGKDGDLRAYQVKSGPIDLAKFERGLGQVTMLVEAAVSHPNVRNGQRHRPFLVTSGSFSDPVQSLVRSMNESWQQRGLQPLTLIGGPQLHGDFMKLSSDFWPVEPPNVRDFLSLYLAEGKGDLDRKGFAAFLRSFFPEDHSSQKTVIERRIAAAALFGSYVLEAFYSNADHWSIFSGWIMVAAYQAWIAELHDVPPKKWMGSFESTKRAASAALQSLSSETLKTDSLRPSGVELDDYTRVRNTIAASAVAAVELLRLRSEGSSSSQDAASAFVASLESGQRLLYWGESAAPHFLCIIWFLERVGQTKVAGEILLHLIGALAHRNNKLSDDPLDGPEVSADEVLTNLFQIAQKKKPIPKGRKAVASSTIESLIYIAVRRGFRKELAELWNPITHVDMESFRVKRTPDFFLWEGAEGEQATRLAGKPQSWAELQKTAVRSDLSELPQTLQEDPDFALMFALVYPHRNNTALVKALDGWFGVQQAT